MSFKHKKMLRRQARSAALVRAESKEPEQAAETEAAPVTVPPWSALVKMKRDEVEQLAAKLAIPVTGNLSADKSAIHKARD